MPPAPPGTNPSFTVDELRAQFEPMEGFDRVGLHAISKPKFEKNEAGTLCVYLPQNPSEPEGPRDEYRVTPEMWDAITKDLGAGTGYFGKTPPELLLPQLNWWYGSEEADKAAVQMLVREVAGARYASDILKPRQIPVSPLQLLEVAHESMTNGSPPRYSMVRANGLNVVTFAAVMPNSRYEVKGTKEVGDIVEAGALIQFSPVGRVPVSVSTYTERLWCTNGMTTTDQLDVWTVPGGDGTEDPYEWLAGRLPGIRDSFQAHFDSIQAAQDAPVDPNHIETVVQDLFDHYNTPTVMRSAVARRLSGQNVDNMWDVMNAFTYAATHDERLRDPRQRTRLMRIAGDSATHVQRCESCHHLISAN